MTITPRFLVPALLLAFSLQSCDNKFETTPSGFGTSPLGSVVGAIESVVVVPQYQDGSVRMSPGEENHICFEVYPPAAAQSIAKAGVSVVSLDYVQTLTKAMGIPENIPVKSVSFDSGLLVVTVDGTVFPEEITIGPLCANARLRISDGTATCSSEYFPLSFWRKMDLSCDIVAVDLGLSVLWGDRNLGADSPEDEGDYYAWGDIMPNYLELVESYGGTGVDDISNSRWRDGKEHGYADDTYKWFDPAINNKYHDRNLVELQRGERPGEDIDDAARAVLGGKWRMPTRKEWEELERIAYPREFHHSPYSFYSEKTGKGIFIPYDTGRMESLLKFKSAGSYWCSEVDSRSSAWAAKIEESALLPILKLERFPREYGLPIRPVCDY